MDSKKMPAALTAEELRAVSGGSRRFVEPVDRASIWMKFAPIRSGDLSLSGVDTPFKFSPLTNKQY